MVQNLQSPLFPGEFLRTAGALAVPVTGRTRRSADAPAGHQKKSGEKDCQLSLDSLLRRTL